MNKILLTLSILLLCFHGYAGGAPPQDWQELDRMLERKGEYMLQKQNRINGLKSLLQDVRGEEEYAWELYTKLYEEYKSFAFDSAFTYINQQLKLAYRLQDPQKINQTRIRLSFVLQSAGMFKEALDTLEKVPVEALTVRTKEEYYVVKARLYLNMADYNKEDTYFSPVYNQQGQSCLIKALALSDPQSAEHLYYQAWYDHRRGQLKQAEQRFLRLLTQYKISSHQYAMAATTLSEVYELNKNPQQAVFWLKKAAIEDIRATIKETVALRSLAKLLYKQGETEIAYKYVQFAMEDANFYGARHRKTQLAEVLPIIEKTQLKTLERQNGLITRYSVVLTLFLGVTVLFSIIIFSQYKKIKKAQAKLAEANLKFQETNQKLSELTRVEEEYIGHFFTTISEYIDQIDFLKNSISRRLASKQYKEISDIINNIDVSVGRETFFQNFDAIFLKIYPMFLERFNALIRPDAQFALGEDKMLSTELRIVALIRLGIKDTEKMAKILRYSVNTIYAYKTKVRKLSPVSSEKFEEQIMSIQHL